AQHKNDETEELLLDIIQNDPSLEVRKHAVFWLSEIPGEKSLNTLIDILNKSDQSALQEEALFALSNKKGERAREVLKSLALNEKASEEIREQAIFWLGQRRGEATTVFLKQLYSSLKEESLKENVLYALSESKDSDVGKWLFDVALNESESIELRKQALFWAGQSKQATLPELERLYKTMTNAEMREQILFVLSQMNNEDSVTMLMEIAKTEQDSELRRQAIFWLGQSKDPRAIDVLEKILTE
ncbi:MAG: HEAT repeat domain-containing protein, partial [Candidatus Eisenbacteria bacterium]|nr:HEAT repeat domain-containing protein [Candidatus Eisenbacteria bacterium]